MNESVAYRKAREVDKYDRWEFIEGSTRNVIYKDDVGFNIVQLRPDGDEWYVEDDLGLWFSTLREAKEYYREEMFVEGNFTKIKSMKY